MFNSYLQDTLCSCFVWNKRFLVLYFYLPGTTPVDYFDSVLTNLSQSRPATCCHPDKTMEMATCGNGVSCIGACSALGASFCPTGDCFADCGEISTQHSACIMDMEDHKSFWCFTPEDKQIECDARQCPLKWGK